MLKVLPSHISNLIAAGEVVQRPSSVVKELMENAVDAGALNISVVIGDSGKTLIQVIDDGTGMSANDAKTAFLRHATSKISEVEDLNRITTLGFRGEALASICSVAEVTLRTKRSEDEMGYEVKFAESKLVSESIVSTPKGSNFAVRNLFYNIPARRKFMKSDATEFRQIVAEFSRIALTSPLVSFKLTHNGNEIYRLSPAALKKRIREVAGKELGKELVQISVTTSIISIRGFIGRPEDSKKSAGNQYFFANNRFFRTPYFQKAVIKGYSGLIPEGNLPSFFIYFETDPDKIDVNIHPTKTEIKFEEDYAIFDILHSVVRESLGKNAFVPSIDFDMEGAPEIPRVNINRSSYVPPPKINYDPLFNPFNITNDSFTGSASEETGNEHSVNRNAPPGAESELFYDENSAAPPIFSDSRIEQKPILQYAGKYIITTIKSGVLFIDIRRAMERISYEKYLNALANEGKVAQRILFPVYLEPNTTVISILKENIGVLELLGIDMSFTGNSLTVNALPDGIDDEAAAVEEFLNNIAQEMSEGDKNFEKETKEELARRLAKSGISGKISPLNNFEAQSLIDYLFACKEPNFTPSGKPCITILPGEEIEKNFK
jgi:DNA mismatch repair protein MutL